MQNRQTDFCISYTFDGTLEGAEERDPPLGYNNAQTVTICAKVITKIGQLND